MTKRILMIMVVGMLSACVSGTKPVDTYVGQDGKATRIESGRESCERSCGADYSRCMETKAATDNGGVIGPSGVFGASGDCRSALHACIPQCKSR